MRHSMSKDTAFNGETTPRHTFLCSDSQCLPLAIPESCAQNLDIRLLENHSLYGALRDTYSASPLCLLMIAEKRGNKAAEQHRAKKKLKLPTRPKNTKRRKTGR